MMILIHSNRVGHINQAEPRQTPGNKLTSQYILRMSNVKTKEKIKYKKKKGESK